MDENDDFVSVYRPSFKRNWTLEDAELEELLIDNDDDDDVPSEATVKVKHSCQFCQSSFSGIETLLRHIDTWHEHGHGYRCDMPDCESVFSVKERLLKHLRIEHKAADILSCTAMGCDFSSRSKKILRKHHSLCHGEQLICPVINCSITRKDKAYMDKHLLKHGGESKCHIDDCDLAYNCNRALTEHQIVKHSYTLKMQCNEESCGYTTDFAHNLRKHKEVHGTSFICGTCTPPVGYKTQIAIAAHYRRVQHSSLSTLYVEETSDREQANPCPSMLKCHYVDCGFQCSGWSKLTTHVIKDHNANARQATFNLDSLTFPEQEFDCNIDGCQAGYSSQSGLQNHYKTQHPINSSAKQLPKHSAL